MPNMDTSLVLLFARLRDTRSPKLHELIQLQGLLDAECLRHSSVQRSTNQNMSYSPDDVREMTEYLSGSLSQVETSESYDYRVRQLRTLIAALALLHHLEVKELHVQSHDLLREHISDRFIEIVDRKPQSQTASAESNRYFTSLYLVRLAAQYFSLFDRRRSKTEGFFVPVLGLVLTGASIASGQYNNLQNIFTYLDQIIAGFPGPQRKKQVTLPGLTEITRNTVTSCTHSFQDDLTTGTSSSANEPLETPSFEAADLLQTALETRLDGPSVSQNNQWDVPRRLLRILPPMSEWFFMYGLIDCATQLAQAVGPDRVADGLRRAVQRLAFESDDEYNRWKAIEFFFCHKETRRQQRDRLRIDVLRYPPDVQSMIKTKIDEVYESLNLQDSLPDPDKISSRSSSLVGLTQSTSSISSISANTPSVPRLNYKETPIQPMVPHPEILKLKYGICKGFCMGFCMGFCKGFSGAGISKDCKTIYFYDKHGVYMYNIDLPPDTLAANTKQKPRKIFSCDDAKIQEVAVSGRWIVVSTENYFAISEYDSHSTPGSPNLRWSYGDWQPMGLAIHEHDAKLSIVIGQSRGDGSSRVGQVLLFELEHLGSALAPREYNLPRNDPPKHVEISQDGTLILCCTQRHNSILIWERLSQSTASQCSPFDLTKGRYTPETGPWGITSTSLYTSRNGNRYLFCTTFPSKDRYDNGGEWPFSALITFPPEHTAAESIHNLESLAHKSELVASAVSSEAHVLALLESNGNISFMGLKAHPKAGICGADEEPRTLKSCLVSRTTIRPNVLQFDASGTRLFAVDVKGNLLVVNFVAYRELRSPSS